MDGKAKLNTASMSTAEEIARTGSVFSASKKWMKLSPKLNVRRQMIWNTSG